jgi:hypothetical protein
MKAGGAGITGATTTGAATGATTTGAATTGGGAMYMGVGVTVPDSILAVRAITAAVRASILSSRDMVEAFFYSYRGLDFDAVVNERID